MSVPKGQQIPPALEPVAIVLAVAQKSIIERSITGKASDWERGFYQGKRSGAKWIIQTVLRENPNWRKELGKFIRGL